MNKQFVSWMGECFSFGLISSTISGLMYEFGFEILFMKWWSMDHESGLMNVLYCLEN